MDAVDNAAPSEKGEAAGASSSDAAGASSSDAQPGSAIPVAAGGDAVNEEAPGGDGPDAPLLAAAAIGNTVSVVAMLEDGVSAAPTDPDTPLFVSAGGGCFWQVPVADFAKINAKSRGEALSEFDGVVRWTNYPPLKVDPAIHKKLIDGKAKAWETVTMSVADPIPIMGYGLVKTSDGAVELTPARLPWWFVRFEQEPHILRKVPTAYRTKFLETVDSSSSERQCSLRFEMREGGMSEKNSKGLPDAERDQYKDLYPQWDAALWKVNCGGENGWKKHELADIPKVIEAWKAAPLLAAAAIGNTDSVVAMLEDGVSVDLQSEEGDSALMIASAKGQLDVVKTLVKHRASVDKKCGDGLSALHRASLTGYVDIAKTLLEHGASVNLKNSHKKLIDVTHYPSNGYWDDLRSSEGECALMYASWKGHLDVVQTLLEHGASVGQEIEQRDIAKKLASAQFRGFGHPTTERYQRVFKALREVDTALMRASREGRLDVVQTLLERRASIDDYIDWYNSNGDTALMVASREGRVDVVQTLLEHRASIDLQNENGHGDSALMLASREGRLDVVQTLLERRASIDSQQLNGDTALMLALRKSHLDVVQTLLERRASINKRDSKGNSALSLASELGDAPRCGTRPSLRGADNTAAS